MATDDGKKNLQVFLLVPLQVRDTTITAVCYIDDNLSTDTLMGDKRQQLTTTVTPDRCQRFERRPYDGELSLS